MRRFFLIGVLVAFGAAGIMARQPAGGPPQVAEILKVKDNLYVVKGGGGNTAAFITRAGVVLVDTKLANWGERIMQQVRTVTDKPVTTIINTHTHGDHTGSNEYFPASVEVVAHVNTKANMEKMPAFAGEKAQFLPDRTYTDRLTLGSGDERIELRHFGPGHTNGDTIVVFPALRVAHTGDLFAGLGTPLIDTKNGGTGVAYPETLKKAAAGISGVDTVIPGHADVMPWSRFVEFGQFNAAFLAAVQQAIKDGKTAEEAFAGLKLPEQFKDYQIGRGQANVSAIYAELKK
ncbi:MBL fold metallo-hydrolase [Luteitalea sp. TBR-22]|uniref:MBL fold metallo-hydrolase n=1 Tax=Luteitalea sp. TBR-22 TaxID=2802971 RepID=UPI001AF9CF4D|nr:MBL fold metallo-hydrolase [Luteitalea sp. TBR-22]BCS33671.1 MBL fold metallo-hydrolase [Luteitalea sp. TBR-22]